MPKGRALPPEPGTERGTSRVHQQPSTAPPAPLLGSESAGSSSRSNYPANCAARPRRGTRIVPRLPAAPLSPRTSLPGWPPRSARPAAAAPPRRPRSNGPRPPRGAQPIVGRLRGGARPPANPTPPSAAASQWMSEPSGLAPPPRRHSQSPGGRFSGGGRACVRTAPRPIRRALRPRERSCSPANQQPARLRALPSAAQAQ